MWKSLNCALNSLHKSYLCTQSRSIQVHKAQELKSRAIVQVQGPDAAQFLQGLMTNDITHLENDENKSLYCMFLNTQGRILYDSIIYNGREEGTYLVECDRDCASALVKHLSMYKIRRKVSVAVNESLKTWILFGEPPQSFAKEDLITSRDPRTAELKWRVVGREFGNDIEMVTTDEYTELRYRLGIGEGVADLPPGKSLPLECNCDYLHGVSFHKGCYIGQELTARTHHTGVIRKRLMPLRFDGPLPSVDSIIRNETGRKVGKVRGVLPGSLNGLGLMRIQESVASLRLEIDSNAVTTHRPQWWPVEAPEDRSLLENSNDN